MQFLYLTMYIKILITKQENENDLLSDNPFILNHEKPCVD